MTIWDAGVKTEQPYKKNPKMLNQLQYCEENHIPFAIIIGQSELEQGIVKLRTISTREEAEIPRDKFLNIFKRRTIIKKYYQCTFSIISL